MDFLSLAMGTDLAKQHYKIYRTTSLILMSLTDAVLQDGTRLCSDRRSVMGAVLNWVLGYRDEPFLAQPYFLKVASVLPLVRISALHRIE